MLQTGPRASLYGPTASWLWLYDNTAPTLPLHVVRRLGSSSRLPSDVVVHRMKNLPDGWVVSHRSIPVGRPALVAVQLLGMQRYESAERQVDRLWARRLLSGSSIVRCLDEFGVSGRNGIGALRRYLDARGPSWEPPASGLESRVIQILDSAGIETRRQVNLGAEEWTGRVDLLCVGTNVVIEVQSELHHSSLSDVAADARRIAQLERDGFVVVEITDTEAFRRPLDVVDRVRAALRSTAARRG